MDKVIMLTKIFLRTSMQKINLKFGVGSAKKKSPWIKLLYLIFFIYMVGLVGGLSYVAISGLQSIHQEGIFVNLILFSVLGVTIVQSIFSSINILYFTKDNEYILPLPLKPYQIILARTNVIIIMQYLLEIIVGLVPLTLYGMMTGMGIWYYITMLIGLIVLPILPVLLISTLVMIIMSFARFTKNRNRFQLFAMILVVGIIVIFSMSMSGMQKDLTSEEMAQMVMQANGTLDLVKGYFPTVDYLTSALTTSSIGISIIELIKTIGLTIFAVIIYVLISQKIYLKGLVGNLFSSSGSNNKNKKLNSNQFKGQKLSVNYVKKEFKDLLRNPVFFMQCFLPAILFPILFLGITIIQFNTMGQEEMAQMQEFMNMGSFTIGCIVLGIIQFFSMFIFISITAVSREGKNAVYMKYIPVPLYKQYIYKIIPNLIMNVVTTIITLIIIKYIFYLDLIMAVLVLIVSTIISIVQSILMIIIDLKRPKLEWDSEYAVAKQNLNLVFPMILSMVNIIVIILWGVFLQGINSYLAIILLGAIYGIIAYTTNKYLYKNQQELAEKIY